MRFGQDKIDAAIARFPATFALSGFPGETFRLSPDASYMAGPCMAPTHVMLYTQRLHNGEWLDFAKGTEEELRAQVRPLKAPAGPAIRTASPILQDAFHYAWGIFSRDSELPVEERGETKIASVARRQARLLLAAEKAREGFDILGVHSEKANLPTRAPRTHAAITVAAERLMQLVGSVAHDFGYNAMCDMQEGVEHTSVLPAYYRIVGMTEQASIDGALAAVSCEVDEEIADADATETDWHMRALRETRRANFGVSLTGDDWAEVVRIVDVVAASTPDADHPSTVAAIVAVKIDRPNRIAAAIRAAVGVYFDIRESYAAYARFDLTAADADAARAGFDAAAVAAEVKRLNETLDGYAFSVGLAAQTIKHGKRAATVAELRKRVEEASSFLRDIVADLESALDVVGR